jgi:hypothetical protein
MTGHHKGCLPKLEYYDKVWYCHCKECNPTVGVEIDSEDEDGTEDPD